MHIIRGKSIPFVHASHEEPGKPGSLKKVLATFRDFLPGSRVQMINWAQLPVGLSFRAHYHEDMEEVFIILNGRTSIVVGEEQAEMGKGDLVIIPRKAVHMMKNICDEDVDYVALGVSSGEGGKTVVVEGVNNPITQ